MWGDFAFTPLSKIYNPLKRSSLHKQAQKTLNAITDSSDKGHAKNLETCITFQKSHSLPCLCARHFKGARGAKQKLRYASEHRQTKHRQLFSVKWTWLGRGREAWGRGGGVSLFREKCIGGAWAEEDNNNYHTYLISWFVFLTGRNINKPESLKNVCLADADVHAVSISIYQYFEVW